MKKLRANARVEAFTLIEVLVVIVVLLILAALLLPALAPVKPRRQAPCLYQQKQIATDFIIWQSDNDGKFPWQVSFTNNGSMEFISTGKVSPHLNAISNYISHQTGLLICPTDKARTIATNFAELTERNISYFMNVDASVNTANIILTGDRNLQADGQATKPGLFILSTNLDMSWTRELHLNGGALAFADGHVQFFKTNDLNSIVQKQPLATNRLAVP